jgi:hypothetical protein
MSAAQSGWARDPVRAAGGRRHYNAMRQIWAEGRRNAIMEVVVGQGWSLLARGVQRQLALHLGVSESTISRDLDAILSEARFDRRRCPVCGARPLDEEGAAAIADGLDRLRGVVHRGA